MYFRKIALLSLILVSLSSHAVVIRKRIYIQINKVCASKTLKNSFIEGNSELEIGITPRELLENKSNYRHLSYEDSISRYNTQKFSRHDSLRPGQCITYQQNVLVAKILGDTIKSSEYLFAQIKIYENNFAFFVNELKNDASIIISDIELKNRAEICDRPKTSCFEFSDFKKPRHVMLKSALGTADLTIQTLPY